jgi:leader peptidase (prepilin peptidase)/N-methyltransferase
VSAQVFVGLAFVVALAVGLPAVCWLRTHRYRLAEEADLPRRSHVWVAVVMPVAAVLAAAGVAGRWPWWVAVGPVLFVLGWMLAAGIDADVGRLPDALTLPLAGLALAWGLAFAWVFGNPDAAVRTVAGAVGMAAVYLALQLLSRAIPPHQEGIGSGDVKLALSIGAVLGWFSWLGMWAALLLAFVIGGVWGLALLVTRRAGRRDSFSFGPAMVLGAALALVFA